MEHKIVLDRAILKCVAGSRLYGTETESSDTDYFGIFIPTLDYFYGIENVETVKFDVASKDESGRNTSEAVDFSFYTLKKYVQLLLGGSPQALEILFAPDSKMESTPIWEMIRGAGSEFVSSQFIPRMRGYAVSQKHKMVMRSVDVSTVEACIKWLEKVNPTDCIVEYKNDPVIPLIGEFKEHSFVVAGMTFQKHLQVKKVLESLYDRYEKFSNRKDLVLKHGYDTKFGSHLIRLLMQCSELLTTGRIEFPLKYADLILDIKRGKLDIHEVLNLSVKIEDEIRELEGRNSLKSSPNHHAINKIVMDAHLQFFKSKSEV